MSMTDPIADMLTRIRNGLTARHKKVCMPSSKIKAEIAATLRHEGYIKGFKIIRDDKQGELRVFLRYKGDTPVVSGISRISRPGLRRYAKADDLPKVLNGLGVAILSTNQGVMTDAEARENNVGGEVLLHVW